MNYDLESIVIKIDTDASGNLKIPIAGYSSSLSQNCPYDWQVSYDDGAFVRYQGVGRVGTITIASGLGAGTNHTVVIKPTTEAYGWAKSFGFDETGIASLLTEIVRDKTYMGHAISATNTGDAFRCGEYIGCNNITSVPEEYILDTVITIGDYFRYSQYSGCTQIVTAGKESIGNSVTTIGDGFRYCQYLSCTALKTPAIEYLPDSVTTIGNNFRQQQYQASGIIKTAKENMPDSIVSIGTNCRDNQYYDISTLKEIAGEANPKNAIIGSYYRRAQYYQCSNLVKARLQAKGSLTNYRASGCFGGCGSPENPITVTILGNIVDAVSANSGGFINANVDKIYVDADLVDSYKSSSAWSNITDSKFVAIPSVSANTEILLDYGSGKDRQNIKTGVVEKTTINRILNGTENWTRDSANNRVTLALSDSGSTDYRSVICTHGITHTSNAGTTRDDGWCTFPGLLACYTTKASLQDFKDWLAQEYTDGTPVIVIHSKALYNPTQVEPQDVNTRNGENLFEITQAGTDVNNLQMDITAETSAGGYQAYMFNGEDYSVESNWIEISDTTPEKPLVAGDNIEIEDNVISAVDTTYGAGTGISIDGNNDIQNTGVLSVNGQTGAVTVTDTTYIAGSNVQISAQNVISATDTTYDAGEGIILGLEQLATKGPCPSGFHVPTSGEWSDLISSMTAIGVSSGTDYHTYLKMPSAGGRSDTSGEVMTPTITEYWSSTGGTGIINNQRAFFFIITREGDVDVSLGGGDQGWSERAAGINLRAFKNEPVSPDSNWTNIYGTSTAGIYHNTTDGLISIVNGSTVITIQDKNLGATTVWNYGDMVTSANSGYYYQRGNNYGFPGIDTQLPSNMSTTQVDASGYGPGNYFSSDTFIYNNIDWSSVRNADLRGGVSGGTWIEPGNTITNTGVLSVNGNTGVVTVSEFEPDNVGTTDQILTKTAGGYERATAPASGIQNDTTGTTTIVTKIRAGTEAEYNALQSHDASTIYHIY